MRSRTRALWMRTEPLHAVVYFDERCRGLGRALGLRGFWAGYFPLRTAPMGPVGPETATAVLGVFAPGMVGRALPAAWRTLSPQAYLDARVECAAQALRSAVPGIEAFANRHNPPLAAMVEDAPALARPLFAANRPLCDRADPVQRLWQLTTALREFRGDAHVAALAGHDLDAPEALVLTAATGRVQAGTIRTERGWTEDEWAAAVDRLRGRGLLDAAGGVTLPGRELRDRVEDATDRLASRLLRPLSEAAADDLLTALGEPAGRLLETDLLPYPNPIGLPRPV
jgi:hypothetical protein